AVVRNVLAFRDQGIGANNAVAADGGAVKHYGLDADQAIVADGAAMQHGLVANGDALADVQRRTFVGMQHAVVLDIGTRADDKVVDIATQHGIEPDADVLAQHDTAQYGGVVGHEIASRFGYTWRVIFKTIKH